MGINPERVREIFKGRENGDGAAFFKQVADDPRRSWWRIHDDG